MLVDWAGYEGAANELEQRIYSLIPEHPEILTLEDAWGLFKVEGFKCDDLQPTFFQASWALGHARNRYEVEHHVS